MPAYELGEHIEELARELGVVIIPPWIGSFAEADELPAGAAGYMELEGDGGGFPVIWVSEDPSSAEPYLVALHELGHHAAVESPCTCTLACIPEGITSDQACRMTLDESLLAREERAWAWAEEQSRIPINTHLRRFIERRLDSYRD